MGGGGLQGFMHAWLFPKITLNVEMIIWHTGSQQY